jgi:hypothetical protein
MTTGDLVAAKLKELPPVTLPSGHQGVLAHVYACGDCAKSDERFIAYLERYTEQGKANLSQVGQPDQPINPTAGLEVAVAPQADEEPKWVSVMSGEARSITTAKNRRCPGGDVVACYPQ